MDAVKFLEELKRMCINNEWCNDCPAHAESTCSCKLEHIPEYYEDIAFDNLVAFVEKWSAEHPQKTRLQDLLEKFPRFSLRSNGLPRFMPRPFGYCGREKCEGCEHWNDEGSCWNLPLEE